MLIMSLYIIHKKVSFQSQLNWLPDYAVHMLFKLEKFLKKYYRSLNNSF